MCIVLSIVLPIVVLSDAAVEYSHAEQLPKTMLVVETHKGRTEFVVEIAVSNAQRSKGLMFRTSLAPNNGMLFDFGADRMVSMWMKNTYIPLDMVFIRADGKIAGISSNTVPHSLAVISSTEAVRYVLEINAGAAVRAGLAAGLVLQHAVFGATAGQ